MHYTGIIPVLVHSAIWFIAVRVFYNDSEDFSIEIDGNACTNGTGERIHSLVFQVFEEALFSNLEENIESYLIHLKPEFSSEIHQLVNDTAYPSWVYK